MGGSITQEDRQNKLPKPSDTTKCFHGENFIESPFFRLAFDPETGRVLSLMDLERASELIPRDSRFSFAEFVSETVDPTKHSYENPNLGRDAFFDFDWKNIHTNFREL